MLGITKNEDLKTVGLFVLIALTFMLGITDYGPRNGQSPLVLIALTFMLGITNNIYTITTQ